MPTPDDKDWNDLTDRQKVNLKGWEYDLYLEVREEEYREMARETMDEEIHEARNRLEKKSKKE